MNIRTFFNKNNTIVKNSPINTGKNPVTELFYGGNDDENKYSRFIFNFDEKRLIELYTGGTFADISKLTHTLKLTNTASFDMDLLNGTMGSKERTTSFDLIIFKITQPWDEGVGYDYETCGLVAGECAISNSPSNWANSRTGIIWQNGNGVYSGTSTTIIGRQHFDNGNENIEIDITGYINGVLTGDTNYGLGIAYDRAYELTNTTALQYVGFFTRHTQTFYEPYIETKYNNHIKDDRNNFYLDKPNKLYLYVNLGGNPTNLDTLPLVDIFDQEGALVSSYGASEVSHVTKGVYSIDILIPTTNTTEKGQLYNDIWSNVVVNGVIRPDIGLYFELMDDFGYYNIGSNDTLPKKVAISVSGVKAQEKIKRGDIRKVIVSARIPYTVEQSQNINNLKYRLYIREGKNEITVVDYEQVEMSTNYNYFLLDTNSLIPNIYYLDVVAESNLEVTTLKNVINFSIVSESNFRNSQ